MMSHRRLRAAGWLPSMISWSSRLAWAALAGTAALPLAGCAAGPSPASALPGPVVPAAAGGRAAAGQAAAGGLAAARLRTAAGLPKYFADIVQWEASAGGPLEVRRSATGRLVTRDTRVLATGVAALAGRRTFVIAEPAGNSCATRLYRIRLDDRGRPGRPSPLQIRKLHGNVASMAASANGHVIGLAIGGCDKGSGGYLAAVHVRSGRIRRWGDLDIAGVTAGNVALNGRLSISANGRLLAFPAFRLSGSSKITEQDVRTLRVSARAGTVAQRSRIVHDAPYPPYWPLLVAADLSPGGGTLYSCAALRPAGRAVRISVYRTRTGKVRKTLARLALTGSALPAAGHCPMALDRRGRYLLAPYSIRYPKDPDARSVLRIALVAIHDGRAAILKIRLPGGTGGMNPVAGMSIAW
jgi:hypothetical protein